MGKKNRRRFTATKDVSEKVQAESTNDETNEVVSSAPPAERPPPERPPSIHDLDDLNAAVSWMAKGLVDTKGFAKYLPHTAQALQEGKVTPEEVASDLEGVYSVNTFRFAGEEMHPAESIGHIAAMVALPETWFQSETHHEEIGVAFSKDLQSSLSTRIIREPGNRETGMVVVKECVDEICEKWAPQLDRQLFYGRKGTFLKKCPLYGINPEEYYHEGMPLRLFSENVDKKYEYDKIAQSTSRQQSILTATKNVASGFHDTSRTCWECKTICQDLKSCGKCSAAKYCSRECQRSAWKKGHKQKCELLGLKYAALDESLKTMGDYYDVDKDNIFTKNGFSLCDRIEFMTLKLAFQADQPPISWTNNAKWGIPSMRLYYQNLERVVLGEIWFFPNSSDAVYFEQGGDLDVQTQLEFFKVLCVALCYDYKMIVNSGFVQKRCDELVGGLEMPASVFMEIYSRWGRGSQEPADRFRLRRDYKHGILQSFMEIHHI